MLSIIFLFSTLAFIWLLYIIYQYPQCSQKDVSRQSIPTLPKIRKDYVQQDENSFENMTEAILKAFINYKQSGR